MSRYDWGQVHEGITRTRAAIESTRKEVTPDDTTKWEATAQSAIRTLRARAKLWDGITEALR